MKAGAGRSVELEPSSFWATRIRSQTLSIPFGFTKNRFEMACRPFQISSAPLGSHTFHNKNIFEGCPKLSSHSLISEFENNPLMPLQTLPIPSVFENWQKTTTGPFRILSTPNEQSRRSSDLGIQLLSTDQNWTKDRFLVDLGIPAGSQNKDFWVSCASSPKRVRTASRWPWGRPRGRPETLQGIPRGRPGTILDRFSIDLLHRRLPPAAAP